MILPMLYLVINPLSNRMPRMSLGWLQMRSATSWPAANVASNHSSNQQLLIPVQQPTLICQLSQQGSRNNYLLLLFGKVQ
jgi:hypothetical protein